MGLFSMAILGTFLLTVLLTVILLVTWISMVHGEDIAEEYRRRKDSRKMFPTDYCRKYCRGHGLVGLVDDPISHDEFCKMGKKE